MLSSCQQSDVFLTYSHSSVAHISLREVWASIIWPLHLPSIYADHTYQAHSHLTALDLLLLPGMLSPRQPHGWLLVLGSNVPSLNEAFLATLDLKLNSPLYTHTHTHSFSPAQHSLFRP